jgi:hypothetical protein
VTAKASSEISEKDIDALHSQFLEATRALFNKTKIKYSAYRKTELEIL